MEWGGKGAYSMIRRLKKVKPAYLVPSLRLVGWSCVRRKRVAEIIPMIATLSYARGVLDLICEALMVRCQDRRGNLNMHEKPMAKSTVQEAALVVGQTRHVRQFMMIACG